jgi:CRISPR-associated protein Cas1
LAWRTVLIQNAAKLTLARGQLHLTNTEGAYTLPLEDILVVILDSPQISLTSSLLAACQAQGIGVITCDETHMPNGVLLPFLRHSRQSRISLLQTGWSEAFRKRLWQKIIQGKIANQAACLTDKIGAEAATRLMALVDKVASGDPANIEAQAARTYWAKLFGPTFRRHAPDAINSALNYGYAVLRATVARAQVAYGLLPCFGLHHRGELNAFNLTDDVMELVRPSIDAHVFNLIRSGVIDPADDKLGPLQRQQLATLGALQARYAGQTFNLTAIADKLAANLVAAIEAKSTALFLIPDYLPTHKTETGDDEH